MNRTATSEIATSKILAPEPHRTPPVAAGPRAPLHASIQESSRRASVTGAADGAFIGLVVGAVFGIATVWPVSIAAVAGGVIIGAAWGAALAYLHHARRWRAARIS